MVVANERYFFVIETLVAIIILSIFSQDFNWYRHPVAVARRIARLYSVLLQNKSRPAGIPAGMSSTSPRDRPEAADLQYHNRYHRR